MENCLFKSFFSLYLIHYSYHVLCCSSSLHDMLSHALFICKVKRHFPHTKMLLFSLLFTYGFSIGLTSLSFLQYKIFFRSVDSPHALIISYNWDSLSLPLLLECLVSLDSLLKFFNSLIILSTNLVHDQFQYQDYLWNSYNLWCGVF